MDTSLQTSTSDGIVTICAWCPHPRERTLALKAEGKVVSHGMCPSCREKFLKGER